MKIIRRIANKIPQKEITEVGAFLILYSQIQFIVGLLTFAGVYLDVYYVYVEPNLPWMNIFIFVGFGLFLGLPLGLILAYSVFHPSRQKYQQDQFNKDGRSPLHENVKHILSRLDDLEDKLEER